MSKFLGFLLVFLLGFQLDTEHNPLFFAMGTECQEIQTEEEVFSILGADSILQHQVWLLKNEKGQARLFYAPITTPVCIDGKCKPVHITLYWNLIGNYVGYALPPTIPLSKYDHESFEPTDYSRLHDLLLDDKSVLKRKKLEDLFDKSAAIKEKVTYKGEEIDAVTGATKKEIKASLVAGALYSCYTLWHLAHGPVKDSIESYTIEQKPELIENYLLYTPYRDYQHFAVRQLDTIAILRNVERVVELVERTAPLTRSYLLKKLPKSVFADSLHSVALYRQIPALDLNTKTLLVKNLAFAHANAKRTLFSHITLLSKNQVKRALAFLEKRPDQVDQEIEAYLRKAAQETSFRYQYLIDAFLAKTH